MTNHLPDHPFKAIGYIRVSTDRQNDGDQALERQADIVRRFAREKGMDLVSIYEDVGSAYDIHTLNRRPGLQDATRRAVRENACLIVPEPTRLFRNEQVAQKWLQDSPVPVGSVRDGGLLKEMQLLDAIRRGEEVARHIQAATSDALGQQRGLGKALGSNVDKAAATKASAKARASRSDLLVSEIAHVLLEDPAYRSLPHRAFADLLNRRGILTGWQRPWTEAGVRRQRYLAEELIAEREQIEKGEHEAGPVLEPQDEIPEDDHEMRTLKHYGMF